MGGKYLTAEEIAAFADDSNFRRDTPVGEVPICAYCGAETGMAAYTDLRDKRSWPACCLRSACLEKWEPLPST